MAITNTTTTTTTTTGTQTGYQLQVTTTSNSQSVGNFVTDVTIQPYIANRVVSFFAYNMRPNQRLHIFFDSVLVDQFCAPAVRSASNTYNITSITNTSDYTQIPRDGNWGAPIYSDSRGIVAGQFNIPAATFKTGDRLLQITEVDSLIYGSSAYTTMASATFTASNLNVTKQAVTLTTINPDINWVPVTNTYTTTTTNVVITTTPDKVKFSLTAWEPLAQALTINTPNDESGVYVTSLELFFKQKAQTAEHGITVYLCETNNGYPDGNVVLPFSTVHKRWEDVNVSNDASVSTKFIFESPVFLSNKKTYAFVVKPDANDPDYYVYTANLGDTDIKSGIQVFSQPLIGTAFYGSTTTQWTALQTEYVKFILNRASFVNQLGEVNTVGDAYFYNDDMEFISIFNVGYVNSSAGILSGDYVFQSTNSLANSSGGTVNTSIRGIINYYDSVKNVLYVANSTGNFQGNTFVQIHRFANTSLATSPKDATLIAYANTSSLYNPGVDAFVPQFASISPPGTTLNFLYSGTSNTYALDSDEYKISPGYETEFFDKERIVASKSNEVSFMSSNKSMKIRARMTTDTDYLSPAIDTARYQELVIKNDIDKLSFDYEEFFNSGNTKSKYISKVVTLAQGQDAEDIQVILTAFRPISSDIQVWIKVLNGEDADTILQKPWAPMYNTTPFYFSDPSNPEDYKEYVFKVGSYYSMMTTNGTITTTNTSTTVTGTSTLFTTELKPGWFINMGSSRQPLLNSTAYSITANTTGVDNAAEVIKITSANSYFSVNNVVYYQVPSGNTAIGGLTGNTYYYVSFTNSSSVALTSTLGGANIDLTALTTNPAETHSLYLQQELLLREQTRKIISIANNTRLTLDAPFFGNYTAQSYYIAPPPTTPWLAAGARTPLTGNVNTYTTNNNISGNGTLFSTELVPGSIIYVNGDSQSVLSITNNTFLTVGKPWSGNNIDTTAYVDSKPGITYLNDNLNLYSSFKQFQVKIILQSDDSSKVPILDDMRVLALQL